MKKTLWVLAVMGLSFSLALIGVRVGLADMVKGEITKIAGELVTIKTDKGERQVHIDPKGTKKSGEIKVGAKVEADVTSTGHANSIKVEDGMKPMEEKMEKKEGAK